MTDLYVDADACPVKQEIYRVAERYSMRVVLVANSWMRIPNHQWLELQVVSDGFDAADDWIVEEMQAGDIVITSDIPLAARCLEKGGVVLGPKGKDFTEDNIGDALASRELMQNLRDMGTISGGPPPFDKKDRSRFLQRLDTVIQAARRA